MIAAQSRPYRALILIISVWVVGRAAALWQDFGQAQARLTLAREAGYTTIRPIRRATTYRALLTPALPDRQSGARRDGPIWARSQPMPEVWAQRADAPARVLLSLVPVSSTVIGTKHGGSFAVAHEIARPSESLLSRAAALSEATKSVRRVSVSAWALARAAGQPGLSDTGQLGGSQAGVRGYYRFGGSPVSLTARLSAPLADPLGKEAAFGFAVQPIKRAPLTVIIEQRVAADRGGRTDLEALVTTGVSDRSLGHRFTLSGYAQAGVVGVKKRDAFADGAALVEHPLAHIQNTRLSIGAGIWGAAQPGVTRLDAGPTVATRFQIGQVGFRAEASYRVRLLGSARPSTGPALSIGTDF